MIVINKKRIQIILSCLIIGIFTFSFQIASNKNELGKNIDSKQQYALETTATPVSGKTVVIDAGHGVPDERGTKFKWHNRS